MNQLQIFILVLMVIFTIFSFWTDLKNFWNTGNKFGEGFTSSELKESEIWQRASGKPDTSLNKEQCKKVGAVMKLDDYPFSVINEAGNPKGCFVQHGNAPGTKGIYYNESGTADCGAHNVSLCLRRVQDLPQTSEGVKGGSMKIAINGPWNTDINKELECKPDVHTVDESPAYSKSGSGDNYCEERDRCEVQINNKCEARIRMWDRCRAKNMKEDPYGFSDYITAGSKIAKGGCEIKQIAYKLPETPEAAAMTAESPSTETPVVNNIAAPPPPEWHDSKLAKQFKLPNGHLIRPGEGVCPNSCKIPHYDQKDCANEILDGKEYRTCSWIKDGTNDMDCKSCGAVLIPKNEYGFARTNPALLDVNHVNDVMKITNVEDSKDNKYNMGKNFMKQLSFIRHFALPDSITTNEYVTIGKLVNAHQKYPKSHKIETILTKFINTILRTNSLSENGKNIRANELISAQVNSQGGNFDVDEKKLSGEGALAYKQGLEEAASDNRLGGSKTLYREMTQDSGYTKQYHPRDPRRKPSPYNSIWNIFNY